MTDARSLRPRLLVVNFFPAVSPPRSGGEQRYFHLYQHLSERFDVTLLSPTYHQHAAELVRHSDSFREYRVPKDPRSDALHWTLQQQGIGPECSAFVVALAGAWDNPLQRRLQELAADADLVIHESPYTVPYDRGLGRDGTPRVYNSYNLEFRLCEQMLQGEVGARASAFVRELEQHLVQHSLAVFATSSEECEAFADEFGMARGAIHLVPNGFEAAGDARPASGELRDAQLAVFVGSAHPPNIEAVQFIAGTLAPALPGVQFKIMGAVCAAVAGLSLPANVELLGFVDHAVKSDWLARCGAALNPLFTGAGTNLKMFDYMASGAPIASTAVGARGIGLVHGRDALVCTADEFAGQLASLLADAPRRDAMGEAARHLAYASFTWKQIAQDAAATLERIIADARQRQRERRPRRRVLVLNDFPVANASGGGQVRISQLLGELGREFDVLLLCLGDNDSNIDLAPGVVQRCVAKSATHLAEQHRLGNGHQISIDDILAARHCLDNRAFVEAAVAALRDAQIVVFEHPYLAPMLQHVPENVRVVYSSLNVEADLKAALLVDRSDGQEWAGEASRLERQLLARADLVVAVSEADCRTFLHGQTTLDCVVVENGVRLHAQHRNQASLVEGDGAATATAVFLGSAHPPNVEAARFIIDSLAPALPDVVFLLVGTVCEALGQVPIPDNVLPLGMLAEEEKNYLLASATVAVNPLLGGGGSSLKVPDFFAAGLPVVSSAIGMRGYAAVDGEHFLLADAGNFARQLQRLLDDPALRARLGASAHRLATSQLDWRVLGGKYRRALRRLLPGRERLRVLASTYRFADPPPGGAEAYLGNLLRELGPARNVEIDVVACAVGAIEDHLHFSAVYHQPEAVAHKPDYVARQLLFPVDDPAHDDLETCRRLHRGWIAESLEIGRRVADILDDVSLLGGWHFPERQADGRILRWASTCAQLCLPGVDALRIQGHAPSACRLELSQDGRSPQLRDISGAFDVSFTLAPDAGIVTLRAPAATGHAHDPRELAYQVSGITLFANAGERELSLSRDHESALRQSDPQRWIDELIAITQQRDPCDDALFTQVRGPRSSARDAWLEANIGQYDVVIAQGVPFSSCPLTVEAARRHGIPVIALPHFHMEDRYYHWQGFYDAFRNADAVVAGPSQSKAMFFDRIGARAAVLPGGGLNLAEFTPEAIARGRLAFRQLHPSLRPFVLVLGRKAAAKQYRVAVDAVALLRNLGRDVDLVMIGPDDDGVPLSTAQACYYGNQARDVVVGALAESACLVNMSNSESFGIVLLEAWMAGTAVVAQEQCLAFADLVGDGINGRLAGNAQAVADAVAAYLDDAPSRALHAGRGKALAQSYSWPAIADAFGDLITRVVR